MYRTAVCKYVDHIEWSPNLELKMMCLLVELINVSLVLLTFTVNFLEQLFILKTCDNIHIRTRLLHCGGRALNAANSFVRDTSNTCSQQMVNLVIVKQVFLTWNVLADAQMHFQDNFTGGNVLIWQFLAQDFWAGPLKYEKFTKKSLLWTHDS